jgi:hypothetical protein
VLDAADGARERAACKGKARVSKERTRVSKERTRVSGGEGERGVSRQWHKHEKMRRSFKHSNSSTPVGEADFQVGALLQHAAKDHAADSGASLRWHAWEGEEEEEE